MKTKTGVFFHPSFSGEEWIIIGDKFRNFPRVMEHALNMESVREGFLKRAEDFRPDMILHNLGHDTCRGDYGDRGLTREFFPRLAAEVKAWAEKICGGRYLVLTHGGNRADVAEYIFPKIIEILAGRP